MELVLLIAKNENRFIEQRGFDGKMKKVYDIDAVGMLVSNLLYNLIQQFLESCFLKGLMMIKNYFDGLLGKSMLDEDSLEENKANDDLDMEKFV